MERFGRFVVKNRILILIITMVLVLVSAVGFFFVKLNSDMMSYLPADADVTKGIKYLAKNFGMEGDATLGVNNVTYEEMTKIIERVEKKKGVGSVMWYGKMVDTTNNPLIQALIPNLQDNKLIKKMFLPQDDGLNLKKGKQCYIAMIFLTFPSSTQEAANLLQEIDTELTKENIEHALGGSSQMTREIYESIFSEIWKFAVIGFLVVFVILVLTTTSFVEPFILLLTLGVSILLNMGSNVIFPSVSITTFAISAILQLGLSMDYAIFLIHAFYEEKKVCFSEEEAMMRAIPKTFKTILSAASTTIFGFIALFFMRFTMGRDLGRVLAKGVLLSMLGVLLVQPCLTLLFKRPLMLYSHRIIMPKFNKIASFTVRYRKHILAIFLITLVPVGLYANKLEYTYMKMGLEKKNPTVLEQKTAVMGNAIIIITPVEEGLDDLYAKKKFVKEIKDSSEHVEDIVSLYTMLPKDSPFFDFIVSQNITSANMFGSLVQDKHTVFSVMLKSNVYPESKKGEEAIQAIQEVIDRNFPNRNKAGQEVYVTGVAQSVKNLSEITPEDFLIVSLGSILSILLILILTFRSIKIPLILVGVIEFGVFINLALCRLLPPYNVNFMAYLIISSVQLGATVDYAIHLTNGFLKLREKLPVKVAIYRAIIESGSSILISTSIIAASCYSVSLISKNLIIKQMTNLIGRGAIISCVLVFVLLPSLFLIFAKDSANIKLRRQKRKMKLLKREEKKSSN